MLKTCSEDIRFHLERYHRNITHVIEYLLPANICVLLLKKPFRWIKFRPLAISYNRLYLPPGSRIIFEHMINEMQRLLSGPLTISIVRVTLQAGDSPKKPRSLSLGFGRQYTFTMSLTPSPKAWGMAFRNFVSHSLFPWESRGMSTLSHDFSIYISILRCSA